MINRKRNFDLIREILFVIENSPPNQPVVSNQLNIDGYDFGVIFLHVEMLKGAGFIEADTQRTLSGGGAILIKQITWKGYEFLDNARNDNIWKKVKAEAEKKGSSVSMAVLNGLLLAAAKKYVGLD